MDEEEDSEREEETGDEEYNGREEDDEMHLSYWIKNKEIKSKDKSKTLCLICYLERRDPVAEIANKVVQHMFERIAEGGVRDAMCRSGAQHPSEASQSIRMWVGAPGHLNKMIAACQNCLHVHGRPLLPHPHTPGRPPLVNGRPRPPQPP